MYKLFTLEEATDLIPTVEHHLDSMQTAVKDILRLRASYDKLDPFTVDANNIAHEINFLVQDLHVNKAELDRLGVQLKDVDEGLIDFPSQLDGEVVFLSWTKGQPEITRYHRLAEDAEMLPLPGGAQSPGLAA